METILYYAVVSAMVIVGAVFFFAWGQSRLRRQHKAEIIAIRIEGLRERRNELQKILSDSDNGRTFDKVSRRLNDVTNLLLLAENASDR